ncbi:hypothetical protein CRG98_028811 [Punica granatum]|uniref:Uncharacterized protein n=1 Tax=Punica granatum TaxID=22663 RepID=A0A2I0J514_PUNGR|nr:hypothetical protein CRG98_028811 [Punica granatum]
MKGRGCRDHQRPLCVLATSIEGSWLPIGVHSPRIDRGLQLGVASILRGYRRPRWKATPTPRSTGNSKSELLIDLRAGIVDPPSRSPVPTEDVGDLGIAD